MNLIVDVGNTSIKLAVFENRDLLYKISCEQSEFKENIKKISDEYPNIDHTIVSSVGNFKKKALSELKKKYKVHNLSSRSNLPFKNNYKTPETLGVDRMALVSAASLNFNDKNVLIIDAGSCITYDLKNAKNEYLGGAISPGMMMRYKALNKFTEGLPKLDKKTINNVVGDTTQSSIHLGVENGLLNEIEGFIALYRAKFDDLTIILTGGDADYLLDRLKNDIFANSNFLLEGLNYILEKNKG